MHLTTRAILLSARPHGEHGSVVRALTRDDGVQPGYVRCGRSRSLRPVLQPGNIVMGEWRARTAEQLPALTLELVDSAAALHGEPLAAAALDWIAALTAATLPEAQPYPRLYDGLTGVLAALLAAPSARGWSVALVRYELLLLGQLGFGLDLDHCVVTGTNDDLGYVSPRTGGAVSRDAATGYEERLLPIPAFLPGGTDTPDWSDILAGLRLTGHFIARDILTDRRAAPLAARDRLVDRIKRAVA
ncbi:DNA repair protein RecO [Sphingomonas mollis]|uniref:DNA repair protein RecO n=1 Tax=Sphingomonas mollis TaxID=2795726 RepID=A0ABS0XKW9_9SPHN|nr:DNA repair protein RecO [Sphingomonas sp. BT553]MBJ6120674.1 DNA repair protein RecO [Sphingomonas sp. BT553]